MPSCCVLVWVSCARLFVGGPAAAPTSRQSSAPPWEAPGSGLNHHELERLQLRDAAMEMFYHGYDNVRGSSVYHTLFRRRARLTTCCVPRMCHSI
jgi:hypothetical protein